jgi:hypothetical protein
VRRAVCRFSDEVTSAVHLDICTGAERNKCVFNGAFLTLAVAGPGLADYVNIGVTTNLQQTLFGVVVTYVLMKEPDGIYRLLQRILSSSIGTFRKSVCLIKSVLISAYHTYNEPGGADNDQLSI